MLFSLGMTSIKGRVAKGLNMQSRFLTSASDKCPTKKVVFSRSLQLLMSWVENKYCKPKESPGIEVKVQNQPKNSIPASPSQNNDLKPKKSEGFPASVRFLMAYDDIEKIIKDKSTNKDIATSDLQNEKNKGRKLTKQTSSSKDNNFGSPLSKFSTFSQKIKNHCKKNCNVLEQPPQGVVNEFARIWAQKQMPDNKNSDSLQLLTKVEVKESLLVFCRNDEYFSYHPMSYYDTHLALSLCRLPQPSNKTKQALDTDCNKACDLPITFLQQPE